MALQNHNRSVMRRDFFVRVLPDAAKQQRDVIIIPARIVPLAVERNRMRRVVREALRRLLAPEKTRPRYAITVRTRDIPKGKELIGAMKELFQKADATL